MEAQSTKAKENADPPGMWEARALASASEEDVFLSPHSDDVCFSLGVLASVRRRGTLLTVFPVSAYVAAKPNGHRGRSGAITQLRLNEDSAFVRAASLTAAYLPFQDAMMRGQSSFDVRPAPDVVRTIEAQLIRALMGPMIGRRFGRLPWLFCPAAVGAHVDHLAVLLTVLKHRALLGQCYQLAFYEDLHYASDPARRERGLANLQRLLGGVAMRRVAWSLDEARQAAKMRLVGLYGSQLTPQLNGIAAFTPAAPNGMTPHEAVWVSQYDRDQRPG